MSVEISTLEHITQADIDAILAQPITPEDIVQTELNHAALPAPRLREIGEDYSTEIKTAGKKGLAVVVIAAEVFVLNGKPSAESHQTPPSIVAQAKTATTAATQNHQAVATSDGEKPMSDKELKKLYETNPYTRRMVNGEGSAAVLSVNDTPEGLTVGQATLIAVKNNPGLDPEKFAEGLPITNPQLISAPGKGEDILSQPIKHEEGGVLVMAGAMASSMSQFREDVQKIAEAPQAEAQPPKEITVESLMQEVLNHPNITIGNDPGTGDRVRKSMQDTVDDGKTFGHDLSQEANQNIAVNPRLLQIALFVANKGHKITIDSMTTGNHTASSNHWDGNAMDILPQGVPNNASLDYYSQPEIIAKFQAIYKDMYDARDELKFDELIYAFPNEGTTGIRKGGPFTYFGDTRTNHFGHIHFSTTNREIIPAPAPPTPEVDPNRPFSVNTNVLSSSGLTANQIDTFSAKHTPAMNGLGKVFIKMEKSTGINAFFSYEHARVESTDGTSDICRRKNNLYGRNAYDSSPSTSALSTNSYAASIEEYSRFLNFYYLTPPGGQPAIPGLMPMWKHTDTPGMYYSGGTTIDNVFVRYSSAAHEEAVLIAENMNRDWLEMSSSSK